MNLALYREFRPKNFNEVIGQDYIVKTLKNQIKTNRLTHAYLFCGPRGTGKTSCAKIFAKAVNCTHSTDGNPCGMCAECVALDAPNTDIIEIDAASNNRVEEIRDLREKVNFPPLIGKYKVYIIDEVHMLSDSAFNALLKTLEEPPEYVIFILATTEIHKLPATILSRCTRFDFKLVDINLLVEQLRKVFDTRHVTYDEKSLYLIAKAGEGSVRDMLSIADSVASFCDYKIDYQSTEKVIGLTDRDSIKDILLQISNKNISALFTAIKSALGKGKNIQVLCKEMADFIKNLIMIKSGVTDYAVLDILPGDFKQYADIADLFDIDLLKQAFAKFAETELDLKYSLNPENLFESACLGLIDFDKTKNDIAINQTKQKTNNQSVSENANSKKDMTPSEVNKNTINETAPNNTKDISQSQIDKIWGNILLKVKENNMFALSNALNSVNKVEVISHKLIVHTNDHSSYEMIDNSERIDVLLRLVKLFDDSIEAIEIQYDSTNASKQDIKDNLKEVFRSKINFKE